MPSVAEINQFRRLVGDSDTGLISEIEITALLNDTVNELTGDFATPLSNFDLLVNQYHNEVIYKAAINWWWNRLAELTEKHSMSIGSSAQNVGEKWDRCQMMINMLQGTYDQIQMLQVDITVGNYSRYSKQTLRRIGGVREEDQ
jgi:hypothetical protein